MPVYIFGCIKIGGKRLNIGIVKKWHPLRGRDRKGTCLQTAKRSPSWNDFWTNCWTVDSIISIWTEFFSHFAQCGLTLLKLIMQLIQLVEKFSIIFHFYAFMHTCKWKTLFGPVASFHLLICLPCLIDLNHTWRDSLVGFGGREFQYHSMLLLVCLVIFCGLLFENRF